ncbi:hypothetical protein ABGB07_03910 [Micromonosporaceae bacterium B7E4]
MRFQLHPDDHERYGDGSWLYDEAALVRLPIKELVQIESSVGPLTNVMHRLRLDYTDARLAVVWIARRQAGIVESFDSFEPLISLATVSAPEEDADPPAPGSDSSPSTDPPPPSPKPGNPGSRSKRESRRTDSPT